MCNRIINYSLPCFVYINVNYLDYVDEDHVIDLEKFRKKSSEDIICGVCGVYHGCGAYQYLQLHK